MIFRRRRREIHQFHKWPLACEEYRGKTTVVTDSTFLVN